MFRKQLFVPTHMHRRLQPFCIQYILDFYIILYFLKHWEPLSSLPNVSNLHNYPSLLQYLNPRLLSMGDLPAERKQSTALQR